MCNLLHIVILCLMHLRVASLANRSKTIHNKCPFTWHRHALIIYIKLPTSVILSTIFLFLKPGHIINSWCSFDLILLQPPSQFWHSPHVCGTTTLRIPIHWALHWSKSIGYTECQQLHSLVSFADSVSPSLLNIFLLVFYNHKCLQYYQQHLVWVSVSGSPYLFI